jgi:hypothetical protein
MELKRETKWFCAHSKTLERFSGQWVLFNATQGLVGSGASLHKILHSARRQPARRAPFVFHVPSKKELSRPVFFLDKP